MNAHRNARTTPYARALIVERRQAGEPIAAIASAFGVSARTVYKWLKRHREGGGAALLNGASAPARPARLIGAWWVEAALQLRRAYRMSAAEIADKLGLARSTVARWLKRAGLGRLAALEPKPPVSAVSASALERSFIWTSSPWAASTSPAIAPRGPAKATAIPAPAGTASMSPSMTPRAWPMSRLRPTRNAPRRPASWCAPCAGSEPAASQSSAS